MGINRQEVRKTFNRLFASKNKIDADRNNVLDVTFKTEISSSSSMKFSNSDSVEYKRFKQESLTVKQKSNDIPITHASKESSTHEPEASKTPTTTSILSSLTGTAVTSSVREQNSSEAQEAEPPFKGASLNDLYKNDYRKNSTVEYIDVHKSRILNIRNTCRDEKLFENQMYRGKNSTIYYQSDKYDFAYCKVPKCGSTFWSQAFGVLKHGVEYGATIFSEKRSKVHTHKSEYIGSFDLAMKNRSRTIIVSRDPYSRLFSAFIDKSYLPILPQVNYKIREVPPALITENTTCAFDLQFREFLSWAVRQGARKTLDRHWAPIISLCRPCDINAFVLVKQESFTKDVEFTLRQVGVGGEEFEYIMSALRGHRADLSLPGIIGTVYNQYSKAVVKKCLGYEGIAERLWHSFQIQGYIKKSIEFPKHLFTSGSNSVSNSTYFSEVVLNTLQEHPMSSTQSKLQRQDELIDAYEDVGPDIIKGIQSLYKQDFEIFGYSNVPPRRKKKMDT